MSGAELRLGAVSYHPRVVTVWERFRTYFADQGVPTDYILYSNYERLVDAVIDGSVDIGWNTNTAFVRLDHEVGGETRILGMRDVDLDWSTVLVTRRDRRVGGVGDLAGKVLALGSRDSGHAAILPLHYLTQEGLDGRCRRVNGEHAAGVAAVIRGHEMAPQARHRVQSLGVETSGRAQGG